MCFCAFIYIDKIDDKFLRAIKRHKIKKKRKSVISLMFSITISNVGQILLTFANSWNHEDYCRRSQIRFVFQLALAKSPNVKETSNFAKEFQQNAFRS